MNKNERITFHKEQQIFALAARQSLAAKNEGVRWKGGRQALSLKLKVLNIAK